MVTNERTISGWFDAGVARGSKFMIVVCDLYKHEDYPVYVDDEGKFEEQLSHITNDPMSRVMEVYDLSLDKNMQMREDRAFHYPVSFDGQMG